MNTPLERKKLAIDGYCHNKLARHTCIARSLSVSDNMTRLERKKLSIEGYCNNKRSYIARSLSVSYNMTRLERKKLSIERYYNNKRSFIIKTVSMDSGISNKMWLTLLLWIHHCENQVASRKLLVVIINHGKFT